MESGAGCSGQQACQHAQLGIPETAQGSTLEYRQLPYGSSTHSLTRANSYEGLVRTLLALCSEQTTVILVQKWREPSKESTFFMQAEMMGLSYEQLHLHTNPDGFAMWRWSGFPSDQQGIQIFRMRREV